MALMSHQDRSSTKGSLFLSTPCHFDLTRALVYPSCSTNQENFIINSTNDCSSLEFEKVLFHSEHPLESLDQEDRVMKHATTRVMKHNPILHGEMSPMHRRESYMRDREVFLLSTVLIPDILLLIRSMHHSSFLVLPLLS
jgi:hypothetical protein